MRFTALAAVLLVGLQAFAAYDYKCDAGQELCLADPGESNVADSVKYDKTSMLLLTDLAAHDPIYERVSLTTPEDGEKLMAEGRQVATAEGKVKNLNSVIEPRVYLIEVEKGKPPVEVIASPAKPKSLPNGKVIEEKH